MKKGECEMHGLLLSQSWPQYEASRVHTGYAFRTQRLHRNPRIERRRFHRRQELGGTLLLGPHPLRKILVTWKHYRSPGKSVKGRSLLYDLHVPLPLIPENKEEKNEKYHLQPYAHWTGAPTEDQEIVSYYFVNKEKSSKRKNKVSRKLPLFFVVLSHE